MPDRPPRSWRRRLVLPLLLASTLLLLLALAPQLLRPRIESAASAALGTPVRIAWLGVASIAGGELGVRGVSLGEDDALTVASITVRPDLHALLDRRIVLQRIAIDGLAGTVAPDASGRPALRGLPLPSGDASADGPVVTVQEIVLTDARVTLVPPPHLRRTPLSLVLDDLLLRQVPTAEEGPSWEGDLRGTLDGVPLTARARADRTRGGTRLAAEGDLTGAAVDSSRLVLPPGFSSLSARASGRVTYELDPERKRDRATADLDVAELRLDGAEKTALAAKRVRVEGLTLDLTAGEANLGRITVDGPRIDAVLGPAGLVYPGLVPALVESGIAPPPDADAPGPAPKPAWRVVGGQVEARDGNIAIRRGEHRVALTVPSFAWRGVASGRAGDLSLTLRTADGGAIDVDGRLAIDPPNIDATARLADVGLPSLSALGDPPLALARGTASGTVTARGDPAAPAVVATLDVRQLHTAPPSAADADHVLAVDHVEARLRIAPGPSGDVAVQDLRLSYPYAMIVRDPDGIFPLDVLDSTRDAPGNAAKTPASDEAASNAPAAEHAPARTIRFDAIAIEGGRVDFVDRTTTPAYWMGVASIAGSLHDASLAPNALGRLALTAQQDELHPLSATAATAGASRWQGRASLQEMSLATLNPYLSPVLGYAAETGTVSVELDATLDGTKLAATSAFSLDGVALRQTGLDVIQRETGVPLTVALGLLKDVGGDVALQVPVEVDTTTGSVALGSFLTQAIGRAVLGALSSPLRWLGMLFGTDGPPHALAIDPVPFTAGSATLDAAGTTRVGQIARILQSHAELDVILKATIAEADRTAVGDAALADLARRRVEAVRAAFASARSGAPILASRLIVAAWTMPASGALDAAPGVYVEVQSR